MLKIENTGKSQIKSRNRVKVFREILRQEKISRKQLEKNLKLSAPSVTRVVEDLLREGLIYEEGTQETHVGRRPIMLCVKKNAYYSLGMNISRASLYLCVENLGGEIVWSDRMELSKIRCGEDILRTVDQAVTAGVRGAGIEKTRLLGIGVASRGTVNSEKGTVIYSPEFKEVRVKEYLKKSWECEILVENNVAADLKKQFLNRNGSNRNLVYFYISDGVGGSIICDGEVMDGEHSMAGKFAHIPVEEEGRQCTCGKKGHLEPYIARPALEAEYFAASSKKAALPDICHMANEGEETARAILEKALDKLAMGIYQILVVLNPGTLVFYGDIFECYEGVLEKLREKTKKLAFTDEITNIRWLVREKKNVRIEDSIARLVMEEALEIIE